MAETLGNLSLFLSLNSSQAMSGIADFGKSLGSLGNLAGSAFGPVGEIVGSAIGATVGLAADALKGLTQTLYEVGKAAVMTYADFETLKISLEVMMGSAQRAEDLFGKIQAFANVTPFSTKSLATATRQLTAMGFEAEQSLGLVQRFGDLAAASGNLEEGIARVSLAIGQMNAAGFVTAQDMNQLTAVGIPAWKALADSIGKSVSETKALAEARQLTAAQGINALIALAESPKFAGTMERMAQSVTGLLSTLADTWEMLKAGVGEKIVDAFGIRGTIAQLSDLVSVAGGALGSLEPILNRVGAVWKVFADIAILGTTELIKSFGSLGGEIDGEIMGALKLKTAILNMAQYSAEGITRVIWSCGALGAQLVKVGATVTDMTAQIVFNMGAALNEFRNLFPAQAELAGITEHRLRGLRNIAEGLNNTALFQLRRGNGLEEMFSDANLEKAVQAQKRFFDNLRLRTWGESKAVGLALGGGLLAGIQQQMPALAKEVLDIQDAAKGGMGMEPAKLAGAITLGGKEAYSATQAYRLPPSEKDPIRKMEEIREETKRGNELLRQLVMAEQVRRAVNIIPAGF